ncbi:MAG: NAD(P)-binding domain-containing protein [Sedimenticola sp.]
MFTAETQKTLIYLLPLLIMIGLDGWRRHKRNRAAVKLLRESQEARLTEPPSLHPVIDPNLCIGCAACVKACPESNVLGIIAGKAQVVTPANCIGHGACKAACPMGGIQLVFGTATRGVDIPVVSETFETSVPGIYIAGELGGMGLIRNAITQGREAMKAISQDLKGCSGKDYDVIIIGAGPAGFAASLTAKSEKLSYLTIEQETFGGTVAHFPRGKIVMTAPVELPLVGKVQFRETTKEKLLTFWEEIKQKQQLNINFNERMERISIEDGHFTVTTQHGSYSAHKLLLSIGRRGTPRKLGVNNEDLPKVVYRLTDPEQYRGLKVLVVGGGDSALEAATSIAAEPNTEVTLSYRSEAFSRAKPKNRLKVEQAAERGELHVLMKSQVTSISDNSVNLKHNGETLKIANDSVIICAGGILPTPMLKEIGILVETKHGEA